MPGCLGCSPALEYHLRFGQMALSCGHSSTFRPRPSGAGEARNGWSTGQGLPLFDHLVGSGKKGRRYFGAQSFRGLGVDHQIVLAGRLHRQLAWLCASEDAINVVGGFPIPVGKIRPGGEQTAFLDKVACEPAICTGPPARRSACGEPRSKNFRSRSCRRWARARTPRLIARFRPYRSH